MARLWTWSSLVLYYIYWHTICRYEYSHAKTKTFLDFFVHISVDMKCHKNNREKYHSTTSWTGKLSKRFDDVVE